VQIIKIWKFGKAIEIAESIAYRPISLLSILSKVVEKLLLLKLCTIIEKHKLIPNHQFDFRCKNTIIEQIYNNRIVKKIDKNMEAGIYNGLPQCFTGFRQDLTMTRWTTIQNTTIQN